MDLIEVMNWRYAVKKFSKVKVTEEKINRIIDAVALSASSTGLQPYRIILIKNKAIREELAKDSFNKQIAESSHLMVFAAFDSITKERIQDLIKLMAETRGVAEADLADYKHSLEGGLLSRTDEDNFIWSSRQAYIALGTALIAAANLQVDTTPMEGFNNEKLDELLNLKEAGLKSVVLLSLGYRDAENDFLVNQKKVRLPKSELVREIV
ncbi:NAD(P)H-dependent oxidoreductase [Anditalea andensis]|uniref:Nitroreductase n=1 Tax=Anditalea andensis TaxID=1048983 RepID=A0A074L550_9BACT|nr:NAD(P)H-dependent oxidoreductase [Anditalea andensis]KEO75590.1 nitroreductase [Anditalea andensis]